MLPRRHIILGAALMAFAAGSALACPNHTGKSATTIAPHRTNSARVAALVAWKPRAWVPAMLATPGAQGLRIAIDPVDGAMGMPAADDLSSQLRVGDGSTEADETPVRVSRTPDGTITAVLDERWADFAVATLGPDGKPAWNCVHGARGAAQFLKNPLVPAVPVVLTTPKWEDK